MGAGIAEVQTTITPQVVTGGNYDRCCYRIQASVEGGYSGCGVPANTALAVEVSGTNGVIWSTGCRQGVNLGQVHIVPLTGSNISASVDVYACGNVDSPPIVYAVCTLTDDAGCNCGFDPTMEVHFDTFNVTVTATPCGC